MASHSRATQDMAAHSRATHRIATRQTHPWTPGFLRRLPFTSLVALLGVLGALASAGVVLKASDGVRVSTWPISPAVVLAIISAIGGALLGYAQGEGVVVTWWTTALAGTTMTGLHQRWQQGTSFVSAILGLAHLVALAKLFTAIYLAVGPLLQRSTSTVTVSNVSHISLTLPAGQLNSTFNISSPDQATGFYSQEFLDIVASHKGNGTIPFDTGIAVNGTLIGTLQTLGMNGSCDTVEEKIDRAKEWWDLWLNDGKPRFNFTSTILEVELGHSEQLVQTLVDAQTNMYNVSYISGPYVNINVTVFQADTSRPAYNATSIEDGASFNFTYSTCPGTLVKRHCSFDLATVEYPVAIANDTIKRQGPSRWVKAPNFLFPLGRPNYIPFSEVDVLDQNAASLLEAFEIIFASNITLMTDGWSLGGLGVRQPNNTWTSDVTTNGALDWKASVSGNTFSEILFSLYSTFENCSRTFPDPTDSIIDSMNDILFRIGIAAGTVPPFEKQVVSMTSYEGTLVYASHYAYFGVAAAVALLACTFVAATFAGFWRLGRAVTLDPIETARAFDPQIYRGSGSNASAKQLLTAVGGKRVRYGIGSSETGRTHYGRFEDDGKGEHRRERGTLRIGSDESVREPIAGETPARKTFGRSGKNSTTLM